MPNSELLHALHATASACRTTWIHASGVSLLAPMICYCCVIVACLPLLKHLLVNGPGQPVCPCPLTWVDVPGPRRLLATGDVIGGYALDVVGCGDKGGASCRRAVGYTRCGGCGGGSRAAGRETQSSRGWGRQGMMQV